MQIRITDDKGQSVSQSISRMLSRILSDLNSKSGDVMADKMTQTVKNWVSNRYPGSQHWSPDKVVKGDSLGTVGQVNVNVAGAGRAYHDVTIRPVRAKALTIPIHQDAIHHRARDFDDLFRLPKTNFLVQNRNGTLVALFRLAQSAFQKQDRSLMPPDEHLAKGCISAILSKIKI